jgi:hypothetical protein
MSAGLAGGGSDGDSDREQEVACVTASDLVPSCAINSNQTTASSSVGRQHVQLQVWLCSGPADCCQPWFQLYQQAHASAPAYRILSFSSV